MGDNCCEAARNGDCGAGHKGCVGENWVSCWVSVCGKQDKRLNGLTRMRNEDLRSAHNKMGSTHNKSVARATETVVRTARNLWLHAPRRRRSCCSPGCTAACGGGGGAAAAGVAAVAVVGGAAGGGYPQHGQEGYIKVPLLQQ